MAPSDPSPHAHHRRSLLKAGAAATAAVGAIAAAARFTGDDGEPEAAGGALTLSADDGSDVAALEVPLDLVHRDGQVRQTKALPTSTYSMVAVTWRGRSSSTVWARARRDDGWTPWTRLPSLEDAPDGPSPRTGTAAWWVGPSRSVQVRVEGTVPRDPKLVLLHPAPRQSDQLIVTPRTTATDDVQAPRPKIGTRKEWGADESWRDGAPRYISTIEQVHVHHTASGNSYSRADTPALIRGMYRYHTHNLGWSDIGYNFLVDKYGRIWEGRAGGIAKAVKGAHTLGFNDSSMGVSVIGNFEEGKPTDAVIASVAAVAAWKLDLYHRKARGTTTVRSTGSDKYPAGALATLRVIDGHRDTNDTACPGTNLYQRLPDIRARAHEIMTKADQPTVVDVQKPSSIAGAAIFGRGLKAQKGAYDPGNATSRYQWLRDGEPIGGETTWRHRCSEDDLGHVVSVQVTTNAPNRTPVVEVVQGGRVTTPVTLDVNARKKRGRVRAKVTLTPVKDVAASPTGKVELSIGGRTVTVPVRDLDRAVWIARKKPLKKSATRLVVSYAGDDRFSGAEQVVHL